MLADGAGTEKCHHVVKSIPSFALKKKERNPQEGRGENRKDYWASTWSQFSIAFLVQLSVSIKSNGYFLGEILSLSHNFKWK